MPLLISRVDSTQDTAGGHLALEKGSQDTHATLRAWVESVRLELLESP